jgi:hypothetical protein
MPRNRPHRGALDEGGDGGADEKSPVPQSAGCATIAELEGNAAEDQPKQHQQNREVEGRQKHRVDDRKRREQRGAHHDKPGLVAIPERRYRRHHLRTQ